VITSILAPFIAGFLAVLIFHQGVWAMFAAAGKTPAPAWSMTKQGPFQVPAVINASFWGGVWGIAMVWLVLPWANAILGYWGTMIILGSLATSLVALLVVFPSKGRPFAAGWNPAIWIFALLVNAAWGFGLGLLLPLIAPLLGRILPGA
jgi:hypothetical protein